MLYQFDCTGKVERSSSWRPRSHWDKPLWDINCGDGKLLLSFDVEMRGSNNDDYR